MSPIQISPGEGPRKTVVQARILETLEDMKKNPKNNWKIGDVKKVCRQIGLAFKKPTRGSHYKISSPYFDVILTIPFRRPLKPVYIKSFASVASAHIECLAKEDNVDE